MKTSKVRISSDFECTQECWKTNQTVPTQGQMVLTKPMMESGCIRAIVVERKFTHLLAICSFSLTCNIQADITGHLRKA